MTEVTAASDQQSDEKNKRPNEQRQKERCLKAFWSLIVSSCTWLLHELSLSKIYQENVFSQKNKNEITFLRGDMYMMCITWITKTYF